jgi:hypothetical protein
MAAICRDPAAASFASAQFLVILPNYGRRDEMGFQEDGFSVTLSRKTTAALIHKLRQGEAVTLTGTDKCSVQFSVVEEGDGWIHYPSARPGRLRGEQFQARAVRLYQPDRELDERIPDGMAEVAAYIKALELASEQYFSRLGRDFGSMGILVAVGIKPHRRTRLWCEQVGGGIPPDLWQAFAETLDSAGEDVRPFVAGPVALALQWSLGAGPATGFPKLPSAWMQAASSAPRPPSVPDELFDIVFPDLHGVAQFFGDPRAGSFDRKPIADVELHGNRLVARGGDEGDRLACIAPVAENDARSALSETHGYGLADAPGSSGHQRYPSGVGFSGVICWHVTCPFCGGEPIGAYDATAGFRTCSQNWRKLVGVEFSGVRWTPLSRPSFFAQAMSVIP